MKIEKIEIKNFRNIEYQLIGFGQNVNIICGKNAQGKTNLLEAIWSLSGNKSFRAASDSELIGFDKENCYVGGIFEQDGEKVKLTAALEKDGEKINKKYVNDTKAYKTSRGLLGCAPMTVFSPDDLELIKTGPSARRNYCDRLLSSLFPKYAGILSRYNRAVMQKNAALKGENEPLSLDVWNRQIAPLGASIIKSRNELIKRLVPYADKSFYDMAGKKEKITLEYISGCHIENFEASEKELCEKFYDVLCQNEKKETAAKSALYGPHRDDILIRVNEKPAREYASQGQQRSCVLALLLAKTELIYNVGGKEPIVLLDDVMSELDKSRQSYLLERIKDFQVIITCCDEEIFKKAENQKVFTVENGKFCEKVN